MSDVRGPIWIINEKEQSYPDGRFDGLEPWMAYPIKIGVDHPHYKPPLDPQQEPPLICEICDQPIEGFWHRNIGGGAVCTACCPICENKRVADAARLAAPDMETVFRLYGHIQTHPLPNLRALLDMLTPPAPKWTATEDDE